MLAVPSVPTEIKTSCSRDLRTRTCTTRPKRLALIFSEEDASLVPEQLEHVFSTNTLKLTRLAAKLIFNPDTDPPSSAMSAFLPTPPLPSTSAPVRRTRLPTCCKLPSTREVANALTRAASTAVVAAALSATALALSPALNEPANAAGGTMKLPPIDRKNPNRCTPSSSAIGQANAARDSLLDLRECDLRGKDLGSFDLSGGIFSDANLAGASLVDAQLSKSYALNASFRDVNFTNAVADRVTFDGADLTNVIFANAVLSDSTFDKANLENVDFTDVYIGDFAQKSICRNPTTKGQNPVTGAPTRESLGCR